MLRKIYQYRPDLKEKARHNRNHPTFAEKLLWFGLRGKQLGVDFDRQKPIDKYILDFFCKELNLGIELDGDSHEGQESYDEWRQSELENLGIKLIRFQNEEVIGNPDLVLKKIQALVNELKNGEQPDPPPFPLRRRGYINQNQKMKPIYHLKLNLSPLPTSLPGFTLVESLISMVLLSLLAVGFWASMLTVMTQRSLNHRQELLARLPVLIDSMKVNPVPEMEWKRGSVTLKVNTLFGDSVNTFNWSITEKLKNGKRIERMKLVTLTYSDPKKKKADEVFTEVR